MINSWNEWSTLKEIVVGTASNANWPVNDPVFIAEGKNSLWKETPPPSGPVPKWIIDQANQELDLLANTLVALGVTVRRPEPLNFVELDGMYNYCPRDRLLVAGNKIVDTAMMYPCRNQEIDAYNRILEGAQVITMPKDQGMILDAANICRLGDTWLFLESASGNRKAYEWLCEQFPDITIELCNFYSGVHIDSTITPLREGLVLLNGSRVTESNMPKALRDWEKIYVDEVVPQEFYQYPYASKWIALNMLVVDPNTVIVDQDQSELILTLMRHNFTVIPRRLSHSRTLGGGFHCVTLDLHRE